MKKILIISLVLFLVSCWSTETLVNDSDKENIDTPNTIESETIQISEIDNQPNF